jgi:hypothetical protein
MDSGSDILKRKWGFQGLGVLSKETRDEKGKGTKGGDIERCSLDGM